ncbi:MAG: ATP phosphoribosyltransferase [bacterium]
MPKLKIVIPKGRLYKNIVELLDEAGVCIEANERAYRPVVHDPDLEVKIMKPQNIPKLLELHFHDIGFTGLDWIQETDADVADVLDLNFDPVKIVAAIPQNMSEEDLRRREIVVASEYENISRQFLDEQGYRYIFLRTFGATEVFPPEDADMIIDNISTGRTLTEHRLKISALITQSSTRFVADKAALSDAWKREKISELHTLFQSILDARQRVMLEMNVSGAQLEDIIAILPCMRAPTISSLYGEQGYAVKVAVKKHQAAKLIPVLKRKGATDILEYEFKKVVI